MGLTSRKAGVSSLLFFSPWTFSDTWRGCDRYLWPQAIYGPFSYPRALPAGGGGVWSDSVASDGDWESSMTGLECMTGLRHGRFQPLGLLTAERLHLLFMPFTCGCTSWACIWPKLLVPIDRYWVTISGCFFGAMGKNCQFKKKKTGFPNKNWQLKQLVLNITEP